MWKHSCCCEDPDQSSKKPALITNKQNLLGIQLHNMKDFLNSFKWEAKNKLGDYKLQGVKVVRWKKETTALKIWGCVKIMCLLHLWGREFLNNQKAFPLPVQAQNTHLFCFLIKRLQILRFSPPSLVAVTQWENMLQRHAVCSTGGRRPIFSEASMQFVHRSFILALVQWSGIYQHTSSFCKTELAISVLQDAGNISFQAQTQNEQLHHSFTAKNPGSCLRGFISLHVQSHRCSDTVDCHHPSSTAKTYWSESWSASFWILKGFMPYKLIPQEKQEKVTA